MEAKKLLIVGIDPGMTIGYAALDIEGNLLHLSSSKGIGLNEIIHKTVRLGKAVLVGTDKAKVPRLVEEFAAKLGARIVSPSEDLKVDEKRKMISLKVSDDHQMDALASALFAFREAKPLLDRIDSFVENNNKHPVKNRLKEIVISKKMSIKNALGLIEGKREEDRIIKKAVEQKILQQGDFLRLYGKINHYRKELELVKNYSNRLKNRLESIERGKAQAKKDNSTVIDFREKRISSMETALKSSGIEIERLRNEVKRLNSIISHLDEFHVIKKLDNLGIDELNSRNKVINIVKNDILLVDDPNIVSEKAVEFLREKVFVIIHKKPLAKKLEDWLPFIFIDAKHLSIKEDRYFGFVDKKQFEAEKQRIRWARKMVENYQKEKRLISG